MTRIVEHPAGGYVARPIIDKKKLTIRHPTKKGVAREMAALQNAAHRRRLGLPPEDITPTIITYDDLCDEVTDSYQESTGSKATLTYNLNRSRKAFGATAIHKLHPQTIQAWLNNLDLSPTTKRATLKAMRYALGLAVEWEYVGKNVAQKVKMPPEPKYKPKSLDSWDDAFLVASMMKRVVDAALVRFLAATALRWQEAVVLRPCDVNIEGRFLTINRTLSSSGTIEDAEAKTDGSLDKVLLNGDALEALAMLPVPLRKTDLYFPGKRGGLIHQAAWRRGPWTSALEAAGIPYCPPKSLRATYITLSLGLPNARTDFVAKQARHSPEVMEKHYRRWLPQHETALLDAQNQALIEARSEKTGLKTDSADEG